MVRLFTLKQALVSFPDHAKLREQILCQNDTLSFHSKALTQKKEYSFTIDTEHVDALVDACEQTGLSVIIIKPQQPLSLRNLPTYITEKNLTQELNIHLTGVSKVILMKPYAHRSDYRSAKILVDQEAWNKDNNDIKTSIENQDYWRLQFPHIPSPAYLRIWRDMPRKRQHQPPQQVQPIRQVHAPRSSNSQQNQSYAQISRDPQHAQPNVQAATLPPTQSKSLKSLKSQINSHSKCLADFGQKLTQIQESVTTLEIATTNLLKSNENLIQQVVTLTTEVQEMRHQLSKYISPSQMNQQQQHQSQPMEVSSPPSDPSQHQRQQQEQQQLYVVTPQADSQVLNHTISNNTNLISQAHQEQQQQQQQQQPMQNYIIWTPTPQSQTKIQPQVPTSMHPLQQQLYFDPAAQCSPRPQHQYQTPTHQVRQPSNFQQNHQVQNLQIQQHTNHPQQQQKQPSPIPMGPSLPPIMQIPE